MNVLVKRATLDDVAGVAELFNSYRIFYKQAENVDLAIHFISERITNNESVIFFAHDDNDNYIGFAQLYPIFSSVSAQRSWVLNDLYVCENHRKLGVAQRLMKVAKELALETNANGISLETAEDNYHAQALYNSLGYKKSGDYHNYFLSLS
ncbi:MAG: GNAT family N-acetyltransferase [Gammaproteobacteria bacterium]|nr:GNAT family N-acetyltransferase [Gammaproteobacteria bacterium]